MTRPNIQIGDEVREMTEEEYANYLAVIEEMSLGETPTAD